MMTEAKTEARIVRITVSQGETGLFYAESPDLEGLLVAERSEEALDAAIPWAISDLYAAAGESVVVIQAEDFSGGRPVRSWIKVPAEVAQNALKVMAERRFD